MRKPILLMFAAALSALAVAGCARRPLSEEETISRLGEMRRSSNREVETIWQGFPPKGYSSMHRSAQVKLRGEKFLACAQVFDRAAKDTADLKVPQDYIGLREHAVAGYTDLARYIRAYANVLASGNEESTSKARAQLERTAKDDLIHVAEEVIQLIIDKPQLGTELDKLFWVQFEEPTFHHMESHDIPEIEL